MARLKSYIKYSENDTVVPMSLVKTRSPLKAKGHWLELYAVCCDPRYTPYLAYGSKKAWVQLNHKGEPVAGPIVRKSKPKSGRFIQVPYNICCDGAVLPPVIEIQPEDQTIVEGGTATFTVVASGSNLTYQWQLDGEDIEGATSSSYTTDELTEEDSGGVYTVIVSNELGSVTSDPATVTVDEALVITTQPEDQEVTEPDGATFTVAASGAGTLSYQWERDGVEIPGATSASYTLDPTAVSDDGAEFTVVVSDDNGELTSDVATLTVNPAPVPPTITTQPEDQEVVEGGTATFTVIATGDAPLTYQWQLNGTDVGGATSASYTTPATTLDDDGDEYTVIVTNGAGNVTSDVATLTVTPEG